MERIFTHSDQIKFAELSGDYNPLHIDSLYARRLVFGQQVVHGIHILFWALDEFIKQLRCKRLIYLDKFSCRFIKPLLINEKVKIKVSKLDNDFSFRLDIVSFTKESLLTSITFSYIEDDFEEKNKDDFSEYESFTEKTPDEPIFNSDFSYSQIYQIGIGQIELLKDFDCLLKQLPTWQILFLLNSTRLVGMCCPGLNSIFSAIRIKFDKEPKLTKSVTYQVKKYFPKLSRLDFYLDWENTRAELVTFIRPEASRIKSLADIKDLVKNKEFNKVRAVVVGGSRGLGEATTKLLALSGSEVLFTYYKGDESARKIEAEILNVGGKSQAIALDINNIDSMIKEIIEFKPTHLFYFATPQIFVGTNTEFKVELFEKFSYYYVHAFWNLFNQLKQSLRYVFYPSSTAIDEMVFDMKEYVLAKSAGEKLCEYLSSLYPLIKIYVPRLPRTQTDQTTSLIKVKSEDPIELMFDYLIKTLD